MILKFLKEKMKVEGVEVKVEGYDITCCVLLSGFLRVVRLISV
jgi:hypothetical protein